MQSNRRETQQHSLTRLSVVGKSTSLLIWGLALCWLLGDAYLWLSQGREMLSAILVPLSESQPLLASADFALSRATEVALVVLDMLPTLLTSVVWLLTGLFFWRLARNELWTARNFRLLWRAGLLNLIGPFLNSLIWTAQGLAVSRDLPPGERIFVFSLGLSTGGVYEVVVGIVLCAFAWMIRESTRLYEENALYI